MSLECDANGIFYKNYSSIKKIIFFNSFNIKKNIKTKIIEFYLCTLIDFEEQKMDFNSIG